MLTDLKDHYDSKEDLLDKASLLLQGTVFLSQAVRNNIINMVKERLWR